MHNSTTPTQAPAGQAPQITVSNGHQGQAATPSSQVTAPWVPQLDLAEVRRYIELVYPPDIPGKLHICSYGEWVGKQFDRAQLDATMGYVAECDRAGYSGIYLRVTTDCIVPPGKRGEAEHSIALPALWADLDSGDLGHAALSAGTLPRPPSDVEAAKIVDAAQLPQPTLWVHSGGGLYPFWIPADGPAVIEQNGLAFWRDFSQRWQALLGAGAEKLGYHYGTEVADLARVLRLPGTINRKVPSSPRACHIVGDTGPRYSWKQLREAADAASRTLKLPPGRPAAPLGRATPAEVTALRGRLADPDGPPCAWLSKVLASWIAAVKAAGPSCHKEGLHGSRAIAGDAAKGHRGAYTAMAALREVWLDVRQVGAGRGLDQTDAAVESAEAEWERLDNGAWAVAAAPLPGADPLILEQLAEADKCRCGTGGALLDPDFWTTLPVLTHIHDYARARWVEPLGVLGVALAQVMAATPPDVVLPAVVGGVASLNLFVALIGESGDGKDAVLATANDCIDPGYRPYKVHTPGSGQGIAHAYGRTDNTGELERTAESALFILSEIDHLTGHSQQSASTILAELKRLYMGDRLGHLYVDKAKRVEIPMHSYRAALVVGVQPAHAGVLLNDADGGTPQRFIWLPVLGPLPKTPPLGPDYPWIWTSPRWVPDSHISSRTTMPIPECAITAIRDHRYHRSHGRGDPLDGHRLLCQLKVAAAFAILNGQTAVDELHWWLADQLMKESDKARSRVVSAVGEKATEQNKARGRAEADRAVMVEDARGAAAVKRVSASVARILSQHGDWISRADLRRKISLGLRDHFDDAIEHMIAVGQVEVAEQSYHGHSGVRYRGVRLGS